MSGAGAARTVLFLDKVFLKRAQHPLRGVELFNLNLLADLVERAWDVTVVAERSWRDALGPSLARGASAVWIPGGAPAAVNPLLARVALGRRRFDRLLVGNVGNGILPLLLALRRRRAFASAVLVAHREASDRFARAYAGMPGFVVAVNGVIAAAFSRAGHPRVAVDYGIFHGDRFSPPAGRDPAPVRFLVLGALDNAWKGADTAIAAFLRMPDDVRRNCELHLASYLSPPSNLPPGVSAHPWMPAEDIPGLLRRAHVMLCPSRDEQVMRETFSQAMVQGMLSGLPIIATTLPILVEKLDEGGGLVARDAAEMARQMERLARDPELRERLGAEARGTALRRYIWDSERFIARYLEPAPAS